jgi:predicted esterase
MSRFLAIAVLLALCSPAPLTGAEEPLPPIPPIARLLPPAGVKLPEEEQAKLEERLAAIEKRLAPLRQDRLSPDIEIFTKAVRYAIDLHEFYDAKKDVAKAHKLLDEAEKRLVDLEDGKHSWTTATRLVVRGYATFDGVQPYGVVFPKDFDPHRRQEYPIYLWLHGRGDRSTDLHFIHERMTQVGQLGEVDAVVIHPFGRQCVGFKSAGETDVISALYRFEDSARADSLPVNLNRTVLVGFSMGGAGAWHIGAHQPNRFLAVAPGAGFAETARYTKTDPCSVPWYERKLWGVYDVPCYTRNLFNTEVIAYSGENDKQIQAARVMEEAFAAEGRTLTHLIGPSVEHKYEPKTLEELKSRLAKIAAEPRKYAVPFREYLQTRTLRYSRNGNVEAVRLQRHWEDSRIDAVASQEGKTYRYDINTKNISAFQFQAESRYHAAKIDGQDFSFAPEIARRIFLRFEKENDKWNLVLNFKPTLHKQAGLGGPPLCGPIDDAFVNSFIVVAPSGKSKHPLVQRWVEFEMQHFIERWRALMRGDVPVKKDSEVTEQDIQYVNLVCFGDPDSNAIIRRAAEKLPVTWRRDEIVAGEKRWSAQSHVPALIYPNPLHSRRDIYAAPPPRQVGFDNPMYLVINSGLTFREAHDKTNSQQNPKLPDWAVVDLTQLPDAKAPGRIAAAGFFDEEWKWQEHVE